MWWRLRNWINRNNGRLFRIDNRRLRPLEITGHGLLLASVLLWVIDKKIHNGLALYAAPIFLAGVGLLFVNAMKYGKDKD